MKLKWNILNNRNWPTVKSDEIKSNRIMTPSYYYAKKSIENSCSVLFSFKTSSLLVCCLLDSMFVYFNCKMDYYIVIKQFSI